MNARPTSITVIGWMLIVLGGLSLLGVSMVSAIRNEPIMQQTLAANPLPVTAQIGIMFLSVIIGILSGIGFLFRQGWMRYVYIGWSLLGFVYTYLTSPYSPLMLLPSLALFIVVVVFLFTPAARLWFASTDPDATLPGGAP